MVPIKKIEDLISKHAFLETELSTGKVDKKLFAEKSKEYSDLNEIIKEAKECGVNAIKLQTYTADTITIDSDKEDFIIPKNNPWEDNATLYSLYKEAYTPWEWHEELFEEA